jgi:large subunit ribosomal protein L24
VEIVRGSLKGTRGEVTEVDTATGRVTVEGVTIRKADQTEVARPVHASNVVIVKLNDSDPWRQRMLRRGGGR